MALSKETVQILVIVFFSMLILGGIIVLITGCVFEVTTEKGPKYYKQLFKIPSILFIIAGVFLILGSLLGLFGAILLGKWLLFVGCIFVFVAFLCAMAGGAYGYATKDDTGFMKLARLKSDMQNYKEHSEEVDGLQRGLRCCGYEGADDYKFNETTGSTPIPPPRFAARVSGFPKTCCDSESSSCKPTSDDLFATGCKQSMKSYRRSQGVVLLGVAIVIAVFEILAMVFGILFIVLFWGNPFKKGGKDPGGGGGGGN